MKKEPEKPGKTEPEPTKKIRWYFSFIHSIDCRDLNKEFFVRSQFAVGALNFFFEGHQKTELKKSNKFSQVRFECPGFKIIMSFVCISKSF
jgi:hypothetical protein